MGEGKEKGLTFSWWVSSKRFTCLVECEGPEMRIVGGAPIIVKRYRGRLLAHLMIEENVEGLSLIGRDGAWLAEEFTGNKTGEETSEAESIKRWRKLYPAIHPGDGLWQQPPMRCEGDELLKAVGSVDRLLSEVTRLQKENEDLKERIRLAKIGTGNPWWEEKR